MQADMYLVVNRGIESPTAVECRSFLGLTIAPSTVTYVILDR